MPTVGAEPRRWQGAPSCRTDPVVWAREANQSFSKLLHAVVEGEEVVITRRGKPVARLAPIEAATADAERQAEIDLIIAHLREGVDLGEPVSWTRDELYER